MGIIRDANAAALGKDAARGREEGRTVFAAMLNSPGGGNAMTGPVGGWAELIEAVEAEGWRLDHWAVGADSKGRPQAYPLFRIQ